MNLLTLLRYAGNGIYSAELTAAAVLEQRRIARRIMLGWYHRITTTKVVIVVAGLNAVVAARHETAFAIVPLVLAGLAYARIADKSHDVINEGGQPCHLCPVPEDDNGAGGAWLDWDDNQPPTAPPAEPDPDLPCDWADPDDLDIELYTLLNEAAPNH